MSFGRMFKRAEGNWRDVSGQRQLPNLVFKRQDIDHCPRDGMKNNFLK